MKKILTIPIFILLFLHSSFGQIGIGTEHPQTDLDVNGSMLVQTEFNLGRLGSVRSQDENFKLLTRVANPNPRGKITILNVDSLKVAPINVVNYKFKNVILDNLREVNLQYRAEKYIVAISNFRYIGHPIKKPEESEGHIRSIGAFINRVFVKDNFWHLEIRNQFLNLDDNGTDNVQYEVTLIIYDKSYFRHLPVITTNLRGSNSGTASSIPNL